MDKKLIALCSFFVVVITVIIICGATSIDNNKQEIAEAQRIEQERIKQQEWEDNAPIRAEAERLRIQKAKVWAQGQDFEAERKARIAKYRQEHNLPDKTKERASAARIEVFEAIFADMLRDGAIYSMNVEFNEVRINPVLWINADIETKRQLVMSFSAYFGLKGSTKRVTVRSSLNDTKMATYGSWGGLKILL